MGSGSGCASSASSTDRDSEHDATTGNTSTCGGHNASDSKYVKYAYVANRAANNRHYARGWGMHTDCADDTNTTDVSGESEFRNAGYTTCNSAAGADSGPGTGTLRSRAGDSAAKRIGELSGVDYKRFHHSSIEFDHNTRDHSSQSGTADCALPGGDD